MADEKVEELEPTVGWFELFYDLVIAASMLCITAGLAKDLSVAAFIWFGAVIASIFGIWMVMVLAGNRRLDDTPTARLLITVQMLALLFAVFSMDRIKVLQEDIGVGALGLVFICLAVFWARSKSPSRLPIVSSLVAAAVLLAAFALDAKFNQFIFYIGCAIGLLPIFLWYLPRASQPIARSHHYRERLGQLTLLCLGEVFLEIVIYFHFGGAPRLLGMGLVFIMVAAIGWQYFPMLSSLPVPRQGWATVADMAGGLLVVLGIVLSAYSLTQIALDLNDKVAPPTVGAVIGCSLALTYLGLAITLGLARRRAAIVLAVAPAAFLAAAWLSWTSTSLSDVSTGVLYAGICVVVLALTHLVRRGTPARTR